MAGFLKYLARYHYMESQYYMPRSLSPSRLDKYLANGWFRSGEMLHRSEMISWEGEVASVINIRCNLRLFEMSKSLKKILKKNRIRFRCEIKQPSENYFQNGEEHLYQLHKHRFHGFVFSTLEDFFFNTSPHWSVFNTKQVCVYDGDTLIATSFFDSGKKSIASIMGLYDPNYSKYSLGIYTMLEEIDYMYEEEMQFYYPGYILDINSMLDYKLRFANQFYDWEGRWQPISHMDRENTPAKSLEKVHCNIERLLDRIGISFTKMMNPLFTVSSIMEDNSGYQGMLKGPLLFILQETDKHKLILEYLVEEKQYQVSRIKEEEAPFFYAENMWQLNRGNPKVRYLTGLFLYERVYGKHAQLSMLIQELIRNGTIMA